MGYPAFPIHNPVRNRHNSAEAEDPVSSFQSCLPEIDNYMVPQKHSPVYHYTSQISLQSLPKCFVWNQHCQDEENPNSYHPYNSYERSTNENINGMIRRFFLKGVNFDEVSKHEIAMVENWINNYPRKILGGISSNQCRKEKEIMIA